MDRTAADVTVIGGSPPAVAGQIDLVVEIGRVTEADPAEIGTGVDDKTTVDAATADGRIRVVAAPATAIRTLVAPFGPMSLRFQMR